MCYFSIVIWESNLPLLYSKLIWILRYFGSCYKFWIWDSSSHHLYFTLFLLPASDCEYTFTSLLEELGTDQWPVPPATRAARCTGVALSVASGLLGACLPGTGARIIALVGGPCTEGPGAVGVAEMKVIIEITGVLVVLSESFGHSIFKDSFRRVLKMGLSFNKLQSEALREAISQITKESAVKKRNFTETIELQIGLKNYDPQKDKRFNGSVKLPHIPRPCLVMLSMWERSTWGVYFCWSWSSLAYLVDWFLE